MSSELILITGPTLSGKTWLANAMMKAYCNAAKIWDEPEVTPKFLKEIRLCRCYDGRAIITVIDPSAVLSKLIPDRIIEVKVQK